MKKLFFLFLALGFLFLTSCSKKETNTDEQPEAALLGTWVRIDDIPGRQPADTLHFFRRNGQNILAFYCAGSPGPNWPTEAETEYKIENGKLSFKDYSGTSPGFNTVESFEWITTHQRFSVKLHQVLLYMSADYSVTYQKLP